MQLLGWTGILMTVGCVATGLLASDSPFWLITLVVVAYGSVVISWNGTSQAEFAHLSPPGEAAAVAAVQTALAFSGAVFGPPLFALIASTAGYRRPSCCGGLRAGGRHLADRGGARRNRRNSIKIAPMINAFASWVAAALKGDDFTLIDVGCSRRHRSRLAFARQPSACLGFDASLTEVRRLTEAETSQGIEYVAAFVGICT